MDEEGVYRVLLPGKLCKYPLLLRRLLQQERHLTRRRTTKLRWGKEGEEEVGDESREAELRCPSFRDREKKRKAKIYCHIVIFKSSSPQTLTLM